MYRAALLPFAACVLLFILTRLHFSYWPLTWPDEALFSSPAAELARTGVLATPVLYGLMPGMERATLWNGPLFMVLLSGLYYFTGESLPVARSLALVCGFAALLIFFALARRLFGRPILAGALTVLLALDPTFLRAANTARMDMLTLGLLLACWLLLLRGLDLRATGRSPARIFDSYFFAGLCAGVAGLAHPAGVLGLPVILIFAWPVAGAFLRAGVGMLAGIAPWFVYIAPHFELFQIQFLSQIERKLGMLEVAGGGDTGGVAVVFFSQYGGTRVLMIITLAVLALTFLAGTLRLREAARAPARFRMALAFGTVTALVILASEAWYALYVGPLWILAAGILFEQPLRSADAPRGDFSIPAVVARLAPSTRVAAFVFFALFPLIQIVFTVRHRVFLNTPARVKQFESQLVDAAAACESIYLRVRPDPYFRLRENYPNLEVLEFIPGKLQIAGKGDFFQARYGVPDYSAYLERRFQSIDCFLLDDHGDWEPPLTAYLDRSRARFSGMRITVESLEPVTLWRRR